uniref:Uncharacterized protein n=1 Tax=Rhizophora mucronata TaxID=61149 RepID=A0A2P2NQY0_RHIMU
MRLSSGERINITLVRKRKY